MNSNSSLKIKLKKIKNKNKLYHNLKKKIIKWNSNIWMKQKR